MDVTQLALTLVGWPNGEKLASTCVQIWSSTKVSASHRRRCTQALAKRSRRLTQVFKLHQLASPFGQGFTLALHLFGLLVDFFSPWNKGHEIVQGRGLSALYSVCILFYSISTPPILVACWKTLYTRWSTVMVTWARFHIKIDLKIMLHGSAKWKAKRNKTKETEQTNLTARQFLS